MATPTSSRMASKSVPVSLLLWLVLLAGPRSDPAVCWAFQTTPASRRVVTRQVGTGGVGSIGNNPLLPRTTKTIMGLPAPSTISPEDVQQQQVVVMSAVSSAVPPATIALSTETKDMGRTIFLEHAIENGKVTKALREEGRRGQEPSPPQQQGFLGVVILRNEEEEEYEDEEEKKDRPISIRATANSCVEKNTFSATPLAENVHHHTTSTSTSRTSIITQPNDIIIDAITIMPEHHQQQAVEDATAVLQLSQAAAADATPPLAPTVHKILQFAIPAIGVWLCNPLLSMIDTAAVGLFAGTIQQAALNPAVAVTDYAALLIAFLYTGTTNLVASAWEQDKHETSDRTAETLMGVMRLSLYVGAGLGAVLFVYAPILVRTMMGGEAVAGASPAVVRAAIDYVRIRALGMPAAAFIGSTQAACLGMQDIKSPLYVLAAAALVNFGCDMLTVHSMGAAGVAWATVASQMAGMGLFIHWLRSKRPVVNVSKAILDMNNETLSNSMKSIKTKPRSFSVRGFLHTKLRLLDLVKPPSRKTLDQFSEYLVPVTATQVGRVSGYVAMSHVVSSALGTTCMAAQQIIVSLFYCLTPIGDSLSLTAQSFVPAIFEKKTSPQRATALRRTMINFAKAGGIFGALMVAAIGSIPVVSRAFTTDRSVIGLVNTVTPRLAAIVSVHGLVCAGEGLLLGQKDLSFLGKLYASFFAIVPFFMLRLKTVTGANLTSVWTVFLGYQLTRCVVWSIRVALLQRQTERAKMV